MPSSPRRFPPPWTIEELDACFIVKDSNEQALGYVYYEVRATYLSYAARKPPLNPGADCVSCSPVLHQINLALNWNTRKAGGTIKRRSC